MKDPGARPTSVARDFLVAGWLVQPALNRIARRDVTRHVRSQLMDLLTLLAERAGQVVTRAEIQERVWAGRSVAATVLPRCVAELRDSLEDDVHSPAFIETIPKRGYRLIAPVVDPAQVPLHTRQPAVLVLPFRDLTERSDQQYFCDGLAEQIINALAHVRGLRVIARQSAFLLRDSGSDRAVVGGRVGAQIVVEGSVRRAGNRIRVDVRLTKAATGCYAWVESFEGTDRHLFDLEDRIAIAVAEQLQVEILGYERSAIVRRYTHDVDAHASYLKGLHYWNLRTSEGMRLCRSHFQDAIAKDPRFPLPYTALADGDTMSAFYGFAPAIDALAEARRLLDRALTLDSELAQAHASLGFTTLLEQWDMSVSEPSFKRALALNPNYAVAYVWYALGLAWHGRIEQASDALERAYVADPLSPLLGTTRGVLLSLLDRYEEASRQHQEVLEVSPDYTLAHLHLSRAFLALGDYDGAARHAARVRELGMPASGIALAGMAHARAGRKEAAETSRRLLLNAQRTGYVAPILVAALHFALGDRDRAIHWLADSQRLHDPLLVPFVREPHTARWLSSLDVQAFMPPRFAPIPGPA